MGMCHFQETFRLEGGVCDIALLGLSESEVQTAQKNVIFRKHTGFRSTLVVVVVFFLYHGY